MDYIKRNFPKEKILGVVSAAFKSSTNTVSKLGPIPTKYSFFQIGLPIKTENMIITPHYIFFIPNKKKSTYMYLVSVILFFLFLFFIVKPSVTMTVFLLGISFIGFFGNIFTKVGYKYTQRKNILKLDERTKTIIFHGKFIDGFTSFTQEGTFTYSLGNDFSKTKQIFTK